MSETIISVVIPCYNAERWIADAVRSVLEQSYKACEVIVVDDGSTDSSVEHVRGFDDRVTLIASRNAGACRARNIGLERARGDYVLFLDADDYLEGSYLQNLADQIAPDVDLVVGSHVIEHEDGSRLPQRAWHGIRDDRQLMQAYLANFLQTAAFLWRKDFVAAHGGWDESLPIGQDTDIAIRMIAAGAHFRLVTKLDGVIVWRSVGGDGRITTRTTPKKRQSLLGTFKKAVQLTRHMADPAVDDALAGRFYGLARLAYACGDTAVAEEALGNARHLGLKGHPGGTVHRLAAGLLGLKLKTAIIAAYYRRISRLPLHRRPHPYNLV